MTKEHGAKDGVIARWSSSEEEQRIPSHELP
jgi:hypothetical protein